VISIRQCIEESTAKLTQPKIKNHVLKTTSQGLLECGPNFQAQLKVSKLQSNLPKGEEEPTLKSKES
jgi:hypothetical protein